MNSSKRFETVSHQFVAIIVGFTVLVVALLATALHRSNSTALEASVSSQELHSVVESDEAVTAYLEQEKANEPHFVTIASLIKQDQRDDINGALFSVALPVILLAALGGYIVARYLLRPVKEAYESQERFMQDAAHELRNPLAAMSLALENTNGKADAETIKTMKRQTKRLIRINEELLYLERRTPGESIKPTNISLLLEDVIDSMQPMIQKKKLKLTTDIDDEITMKILPKDFIMLSRNIIENAAKYSHDSKPVTVSLKEGKHITFVVKDKGIGISADELDKVGQRFFRAKNAARIDGTGLGMAIVVKIVNLYGGRMQIESRLKHGTTVKIKF